MEYARIHKANNTRYADAAERILLTNSTKSLFVADVGFHKKEGYEKFRSTHWKNKFEYKEKKESQTDNSMIEVLNLVEVHKINRHEVYTLAQLRKFYDEVKGNISSSSRSIDIKESLINKFGDEITFAKPSGSSFNISEYVLPSNIDFLPNAINSLATGIS